MIFIAFIGDGTASSDPIVIAHGGEYRGHWRSDDPGVAAVTIKTSEPVVIANSVIESRGPLVVTRIGHAKLTLRGNTARGLDPRLAGRCAGRFLSAEEFDSVVVENNSLEGTSGIYLLKFDGPTQKGPTVRVVGNVVRNVDGRKSDGQGGYFDYNDRRGLTGRPLDSGYEAVQFLQLDKVRRVPRMEVAWNEIVNEPGKSRVEDNINIFLSSGTPESPLLIHDNYIQGAYTIRPWQGNTSDGQWKHDWSYSGGGILLGDGSTTVKDGMSAFVRAERNQVVATTNYGIAIANGHNLEIAENRVIASGRLPDGRLIAAQNVGVYIWDTSHDRVRGRFFGNRGWDNAIGWISATGKRNDWWLPDATSWERNLHLPDPVDRKAEEAEHARWRAKVKAAGRKIGPTGSAMTSPPTMPLL